MQSITAIILTKNEEKNVGQCLKSIQNLVERMVVVDSGSTDATLEIAKSYGADIYHNDFQYYAQQFNWGIDNTDIKTEWILRIDADEVFPEQLCDEIEEIIQKNEKDVNGITIEANLYFLGRHIKHGSPKKRKMMLFKAGIGRIEDRRRDAQSILEYGKSVSAKNKFDHYDFKSLDQYIKRCNWYATREMQDYIDYKNGVMRTDINTDADISKQRSKKFGIYYKAPMFFRAHLWFILNYYFKLGFLDGKEGKIFWFLECYWYRFIVDAKIYEYEHCDGEIEQLKALD